MAVSATKYRVPACIAGVVFAVFVVASDACANVIYAVNTVFNTGSVTGYIETDGTIGTLHTVNVTDWMLTLTSPLLRGGSPHVLTATSLVDIQGSAITATTTALLFDFTLPGQNYILIQENTPENQFWCIVNTIGCGVAAGIQFGHGLTTVAAEFVPGSGTDFVFATAVSESATSGLISISLVGLALSAFWRRPRKFRILPITFGAVV